MSVQFPVSDEEWPLYDAIWWSMCGYHQSDSPSDKNIPAFDFLETLADEEFPYISGEPGWTISRYFLFEKGLPVDFSLPPWRWSEGETLELKRLQDQGAQELFGVDHCDVTPRYRTYSSEVFWRAVRESLLAFGGQHPERWHEIEEGFRRFTELGSFPGRLSD